MNIHIYIHSRKDKEILLKMEELRKLIITSVKDPERIKVLTDKLSESTDDLKEAIKANPIS